jgi:hypothetical protein
MKKGRDLQSSYPHYLITAWFVCVIKIKVISCVSRCIHKNEWTRDYVQTNIQHWTFSVSANIDNLFYLTFSFLETHQFVDYAKYIEHEIIWEEDIEAVNEYEWMKVINKSRQEEEPPDCYFFVYTFNFFFYLFHSFFFRSIFFTFIC